MQKKTYQFTTQCKGNSHALKTAKITVFDPMMCKSPDVPLQAELLALTIQLRTSRPSILAVLYGWEYIIQVGSILHIIQTINTAARPWAYFTNRPNAAASIAPTVRTFVVKRCCGLNGSILRALCARKLISFDFSHPTSQ